jgi:hypothetical protein
LSEHAFDPIKLDLETYGYDLGSAEEYIMEPLEVKKSELIWHLNSPKDSMVV